jgi:DGQHR domain-containing protein
MRSSDLFRLSYFDIRHLNQDNGIDQFMGIQRTLNEKRVQQIAEYVTSVDATFPTAVVLAVDERCARIEELDCGSGVRGSGVFKLFLKNIPNPEPGEDPVLFRQIARVIDGQHRIKGLEGYGGANFEVNVAIFIGLDLAACV